MSLRDEVFEALNNAVENGYDMRVTPVADIVDDLLTCDATLEGTDPELLAPIVQEWLDDRALED